MNLNPLRSWTAGLLICSCGVMLGLTGCQSTVGGQTLPSADYLHDDIQFFPAGPEFKLTNQVQAIEQYNLEQQGLATGTSAPSP